MCELYLMRAPRGRAVKQYRVLFQYVGLREKAPQLMKGAAALQSTVSCNSATVYVSNLLC